MDIDSNFDEDFNSVNALQKKKRKKDPEIELKKKVTFDCTDDNLSNEETFDYEYEDEETTDDDLENVSDKKILDDKCEDEYISDEDCYSDDGEEESNYDHDEENCSKEDCFNSQSNEELLGDNYKIEIKTENLKEDIYGRLRKPDGSVVVSYLF